MTNEELKKKIVDIALHAEWMDMFGDHNSIGKYAANAIADALIAAGIGDVKDVEAEANRYEMLYKLQNRDMALAERHTGIPSSNIVSCLKGRQSYTKEYSWCYV